MLSRYCNVFFEKSFHDDCNKEEFVIDKAQKNPAQKNALNETGGELSRHAKDFYLKEYELLRREIEIAINDYRATERNVVIAVGVSWAWLFQAGNGVPVLAWLVPCLFVVLGILRNYSDEAFFQSAHQYLARVEKAFSLPGHPGGWEHAPVSRNWTRASAVLFWIVLALATIVVATFEIRLQHVARALFPVP